MPEPTSGDLERWLLRRGITLGEYERMPWVRRDFLYSEFRREWSGDPWTLIEKVLRNIDVLRRLVFLVEIKGSPRHAPQEKSLQILRECIADNKVVGTTAEIPDVRRCLMDKLYITENEADNLMCEADRARVRGITDIKLDVGAPIGREEPIKYLKCDGVRYFYISYGKWL